MSYLFEQSVSQMFLLLALIVGVGLLSVFLRRDRSKRSSWPTWLLVPIASAVLPVGSMPNPPDPLRPIYLLILALVLARWVAALVVHERSRGWVSYLVLLLSIPFVLIPAMEGFPPRFLP